MTLKVSNLRRRRGQSRISGTLWKALHQSLTTNPTLMKKAGIKDYEGFAKDILTTVNRLKPISLEVFSDEFPEMNGRP